MKILLASSSSGSRGGGELYLVYLGRALAARGHEVTLWTSNHPRMLELCHLFAPYGRVVRSDYRNTYDYRTRSLANAFNFKSAARIRREWKALKPDVIHVNKQNLEDGLDLLRAAGKSRIPHVSTIHLTQSARYLRAQMAGLRDFVSRRALRRDRGALVCVLDERARDLRSFLGSTDRARVVPNGVELYDLRGREVFRVAKRQQLGIKQDETLLIAVGRLVPQKRPLVFLDLAQRIQAKLPKTKFVWVGDGKLAPEWDREVERRNMRDFTCRLDWQSDVRDCLFAADAFLHTAEFEGLPLAILEALSAALPCAVTPNLMAEMPFLNPTNSIAIGEDDSWSDTLANREKLAELGLEARRLAEEQFSFDLMAQRYEELYREAMAKNASKG